MKNNQITIDINPDIRYAAKLLAKKFDVSLKYIIRIALIDILKKHNCDIPVEEL